AEEALEAAGVELIRAYVQEIAGLASDEPAVAERLSQLRDVDVHAVQRARRRALAPERVDQTLGRNDLAGVEKQQRKQAALLVATELDRASPYAHLDRAEHEELHRSLLRHRPRLTPVRGAAQRRFRRTHKPSSRPNQAPLKDSLPASAPWPNDKPHGEGACSHSSARPSPPSRPQRRPPRRRMEERGRRWWSGSTAASTGSMPASARPPRSQLSSWPTDSRSA